MSTDYYTATGKPSSHGTGSSNEMRSEFASIEGGFAKLPALTGNNGKVVFVNANGTGMESKTAAQTLTAIGGLSAALLPNVSTTVNASSAELNNVVGVTSAIQTQLNNKAAIGANTDITSLSALASINGGQIAGFRNRIINGACDIAQRVASIAAPVGTDTYGGPDRYKVQNLGAGGQFTQSQSTLTYSGVVKNTVRQTVNTATTSFTGTNYWRGIAQFIEGYNCYDLINQAISVSFIFNTNIAGTYSVSLIDAYVSGHSYVTSFTVAANTPTKIAVNIPAYASLTINRDNAIGLYLSIGFLNQGTYQTSTLNTWQTGNLLSVTGATNWAATAGNFIELTELQLEAGAVATAFERRLIEFELAMCRRYYESTWNGLTSANSNLSNVYASVAFGTGLTQGRQFLVPKRAAPAVLLYSRNGTVNNLSSVTTGVDVVSSTVAQNISTTGFQTAFAAGSPFTSGAGYEYCYTASAEF